MDKIVILYTMNGCPFCSQMKEKLNEEQIKFYERDIEEYNEEYEMFVEITENEYVPAFMILYSNFDSSIGHFRRYNKKELMEG